MAYGGVLIQSPVPTCTEHEDEELTVLCYTCIQRICDICFKNNHVQHEWKTMAKVIREVRMNWRERETALLGILSEIQEAALDRETEDQVQKVRVTESRLISMIQDHANKLVQTLQQGREGIDASDEVSKLEEMIRFFSIHVTDAHENVIFETEEMFLRMCHTHKTRKQRPKSSPRFREGEITEDAITNIFGDVIQEDDDDDKDEGEENDDNEEKRGNVHVDDEKRAEEKPANTTDVEQSTTDDDERNDPAQTNKHDDTEAETKRTVTEIASFTHGTDVIMSIAPITATQAWIHEYATRRATDVWRRDTSMEDFIVLDDGDFMYTYVGNKTIYRALKSGKTNKVCSTSAFYPRGICRGHGGAILVCLCECDVPQITPDSRGEIHHMELSGKIIRKYTRSDNDKTKLFTHPVRVAQNINKGICVVDIIDKDFTSRLVVLTVEGVVRFCLQGTVHIEGEIRLTWCLL